MSRGIHMSVALLVAGITALGGAGCSALEEPGGGSGTELRVDRVVDGDTIDMHDGSTVRLVQIDAPERRDSECGNELATRELEQLLPEGVRVTLQIDPALDERDRFGRLLRYVVLEDGTNVNEQLVVAGVAAPYFFRGERGRLASKLVDAARAARASDRGVWGHCPDARLDPERAWSTQR